MHDLRRIAATIMINQGVPPAVVSQTLRHKNVAATVDLYGHRTRDAADDGVSATCAALDAADAREPWPADAEQLAGAVREGLAMLLIAGVGQRAEVAEDHRAHDPHTDARRPPVVRGPPARRFRAVDQDPRKIRLPLYAAPLCEPLISLARLRPAFPARLYPAGVSFKPKPRRTLSRSAFPRSAVKEFKRPSKVVEDAGHFKS
ncbi:hypothetical protein Acsp02_67730 [Actinoplanes sp. NBRC 103695]|nr:hypothetical protein Acsp02_67730 [Actinoplanes sp. NBRC 103695]